MSDTEKLRSIAENIKNAMEKDMVNYARQNPDEDPLRSRLFFLRNELAAQIVNIITTNKTLTDVVDDVRRLKNDMEEVKASLKEKKC